MLLCTGSCGPGGGVDLLTRLARGRLTTSFGCGVGPFLARWYFTVVQDVASTYDLLGGRTDWASFILLQLSPKNCDRGVAGRLGSLEGKRCEGTARTCIVQAMNSNEKNDLREVVKASLTEVPGGKDRSTTLPRVNLLGWNEKAMFLIP